MQQMSTWILVVDDDGSIAAMICDFLADEGYVARACFSASKAWQLIQQEQPALIITDLWMEGRYSGFELVQQMRQASALAAIPAILCAADRPFLKQKAAELARLNCMSLDKPFDLEALLEKVQAVLGSPNS